MMRITLVAPMYTGEKTTEFSQEIRSFTYILSFAESLVQWALFIGVVETIVPLHQLFRGHGKKYDRIRA